MSIADKIRRRLQQFTEDLEAGKPIEATEVRCEQTQDGPLHTRRKVTLQRHEWRCLRCKADQSWINTRRTKCLRCGAGREWLTKGIGE